MEYEQILREQRGEVVLLTLNRPDRLNAWTFRMSAELADAIEAADADESVGAVVVTGAGRGFCAGADMSAVFDSPADDPHGGGGGGDGRATDWVDLVRRTKPKVASQLSECGGAGTGCGWCIPFLKQIHQQVDAEVHQHAESAWHTGASETRVPRADCCRAYSDEQFAGPRVGSGYILDLNDVRWAVAAIDGGLHQARSPCSGDVRSRGNPADCTTWRACSKCR